MSENTKFNLEYAIKQGYRVADDFAASRVMFEKKHYLDNTTWRADVDWQNGNYQEVNLNVTDGNQWVRLLNPGSAGIYYLLLRKGSPDQYRARLGDGSTYHNIEWLGEALTDNHIISMATGTALLITFLWDGTKYTAHIVPKEVVGRIPKHGYFYNWAAVNSGKLDIPGWHVPTTNEFYDLHDQIYNNNSPASVGYRLKAEPPLFDGIDQYGFKALPTGRRDETGSFTGGTTLTNFWTSTEISSPNANSFSLQLSIYSFGMLSFHRRRGLSVRLIRNSLSGYVEGEKVKDIDGNIYDTVRITMTGYDQVWLKQNLATGRYNDGVGIPYITSSGSWANLNIDYGAMCAFNNDLQHVFE